MICALCIFNHRREVNAQQMLLFARSTVCCVVCVIYHLTREIMFILLLLFGIYFPLSFREQSRLQLNTIKRKIKLFSVCFCAFYRQVNNDIGITYTSTHSLVAVSHVNHITWRTILAQLTKMAFNLNLFPLAIPPSFICRWHSVYSWNARKIIFYLFSFNVYFLPTVNLQPILAFYF